MIPRPGEWLRLPAPTSGPGPPACRAVSHDRPSRAGPRGRGCVPAPSAGPARIRAEPWGSCRLSAKAPCARSHEHASPKTLATQGCSRCDGHHSQSVPPCPARRTPTLRRFTPSQTRRVDGALSRTVARGAWTDKQYERGRPCSALLLRGASVPSSRPVSPGVYRRGESTPHACIVHSAGDSSACCERRSDGLSPATACAGAWPCLFGQDGGLLWAGGRLALCPRSVRPAACADQGRLSVSRQDSGPSERPPRFPER